MPDPLNVVVDVSHHNGNVNFAKANDAGILGVIQKATQTPASAGVTGTSSTAA